MNQIYENDYSYFNLLNRGKILDLGSGTGLFSIAAKEKGFDEAVMSQANNKKIKFFNLGIKNNFQNLLKKELIYKANVSFRNQLKKYKYKYE